MRRGFQCIAIALLLAACDDMATQDRAAAPAGPPLPPVAGTVARGDLAPPPEAPDQAALLARGADRFAIHCTPCHGPAGAGDGPVAGRLLPAPPPFWEAEAATPEAVERVLTHGQGFMPSYAERLPPADRRAVAAHVLRLRAEGEP